MLIGEIKRTLRFLPYTYYFRSAILFSLVFPAFSFIFANMMEDISDLSLTVFYCAFPGIMIGSQMMRTDFTTVFSVSAHRKTILTKVIAILSFVMMLISWGMFLLVFNFAQKKAQLEDSALFVFVLQFLLLYMIFYFVTLTQFRLTGWAYYVTLILYMASLFAITFGLLRSGLMLHLMNLAIASKITRTNATLIVMAGGVVIALINYTILCATYRLPVNKKQLDRAKF